jgi:hypothetical protein
MRKNKLVIFPLILITGFPGMWTSGNDVARESTIEAISASVRATGTASAAQGLASPTRSRYLSSDSLTATAEAFAPILPKPAQVRGRSV